MPRFNRVVLSSRVCFTALTSAALALSCSAKKELSSAVPIDLAPVPAASSASGQQDLAALDREMLEQAQGDPRARLIQSAADLTIESKHQDSLHQRLADRTEMLGGYIVESTKQRTQVRVPAGEFDGLLEEMSSWGKVARRTITGADVTEGFRDLRLELDHAELRKRRLLELLSQTQDVDAKLKIEAELERVSLVIDRLTAQMAEMRHGLKFATITMETTKPDKDWKPGYVLEGLHIAFKGVRSLLVAR